VSVRGATAGSADGDGEALTDAEVMAGVVQACPDAFALLYDRYSRLSFSLALRILGETQSAEDAVQEAFLSIWRRAASYREERGSVRSWVCSIVHNRAVDRLRGQKGQVNAVQALDRNLQERLSTDSSHEGGEQIACNEIREALGALPPEQRHIIELAYFAGFTQSEISDMLRLPLGTVKSRTRLALQKLQVAVA